MHLWCQKKGDLLYSERDGQISATKSARKLAAKRRCGRKFAMSRLCAAGKDLISADLAVRLGDPHFSLPEALAVTDAKSWTG